MDDNLEVAYDLLHNHFDKLNLSSTDLNNALHLVSGTTHSKGLRTVTELLTRGADPNARRAGNGETPLFLASYVGNLGIVSELLGVGAYPDIGTNDDVTPLMMASQQGHVKVVRELLTGGADMNLKDFEGYTALDYANAEVRAILMGKLKQQLSPTAQWAHKQTTEHTPLLREGGRRTRRLRKSRGSRRKVRR